MLTFDRPCTSEIDKLFKSLRWALDTRTLQNARRNTATGRVIAWGDGKVKRTITLLVMYMTLEHSRITSESSPKDRVCHVQVRSGVENDGE